MNQKSGMLQKNKMLQVQRVIWDFIILIIMVFQFFASMNYRDDAVYAHVLDNISLSEFIYNRYFDWSSRVVIETVMVLLVYAPAVVWRILNGLMIVLAIVMVEKIFGTGKEEDRYKTRILFSCCILSIPLMSIKSAGWIATTTNYLWVLSLGLVALYSLKSQLENRKATLLYICSVPALIYAVNMEQMAAIILGTCLTAGTFGAYKQIKKKQIPWG